MSDVSTVSGSEGGATATGPGATSVSAPQGTQADSHSRPLNFGQAPEPTPSEPPAFSVPERYKEAQWAQGLDSYDKLWDQFDNAQKLIGKKTIGIPGPDATPEQWQEYYSKVRPEKYEPIKRNIPEPLKEQIKGGDEATLKGFHELGLTQQQAQGVYDMYDKVLSHQYEQQQQAVKQRDQQFSQMAEKLWGNETDEVISRAGQLLTKYAPDEFKEHIPNLDNVSTILLAGVLNNVAKQHRMEDGPGGGGDPIGGVTADQIHSQISKLRNDPSLKDQFHPQYDANRAKLTDLYRQLERLKK